MIPPQTLCLSAQVAQSVEQRTENPRVAGSIPALGTFKWLCYTTSNRRAFPFGSPNVSTPSTFLLPPNALKNIRQFYSTYQEHEFLIRYTVCSQSKSLSPGVSWSHYLLQMRVSRPEARSFYEIECIKAGMVSKRTRKTDQFTSF